MSTQENTGLFPHSTASSPTRYIVAIDSLKECLPSAKANEAVAKGILSVQPDAQVAAIEVSDGGEGFLSAMRPDRWVTCPVHDAMMRPIAASYGMTGDTAIIEVARVVGLQLIEPELRNPLRATSYGLGEMIVHAMDNGCSSFVVGLGGTATSDCGLGMLKALKRAQLFRRRLPDYAPFDLAPLKSLRFTLATDVSAPLLGEQGAARVFAPQKGASAEDVVLLERRAATFAHAAARQMGVDCSQLPGAGAAGGLGYCFLQMTDAHCEPGAAIVLERNGFDHLLETADVVITGEGHADKQTLMGKLPAMVLQRASQRHVPTCLLAGLIDDAELLRANGFHDIININEGHPVVDNPKEESVAMERLADAGRRIACRC